MINIGLFRFKVNNSLRVNAAIARGAQWKNKDVSLANRCT
jgi:hypothetical protein